MGWTFPGMCSIDLKPVSNCAIFMPICSFFLLKMGDHVSALFKIIKILRSAGAQKSKRSLNVVSLYP
jgi:hypothetical protein